MTPGQVLFDQAGLGRGKVRGRGIGKGAAVRGLERGTSFGEVRADVLCAPLCQSMIFMRYVHVLFWTNLIGFVLNLKQYSLESVLLICSSFPKQWHEV
jgi:hypothetical protein